MSDIEIQFQCYKGGQVPGRLKCSLSRPSFSVVIDVKITFEGKDIYSDAYDVIYLRTNVGMVFQKPNPFPMSIYDNVAYGPKNQGIKDKKVLDKIVTESLKGAALWYE